MREDGTTAPGCEERVSRPGKCASRNDEDTPRRAGCSSGDSERARPFPWRASPPCRRHATTSGRRPPRPHRASTSGPASSRERAPGAGASGAAQPDYCR